MFHPFRESPSLKSRKRRPYPREVQQQSRSMHHVTPSRTCNSRISSSQAVRGRIVRSNVLAHGVQHTTRGFDGDVVESRGMPRDGFLRRVPAYFSAAAITLQDQVSRCDFELAKKHVLLVLIQTTRHRLQVNLLRPNHS